MRYGEAQVKGKKGKGEKGCGKLKDTSTDHDSRRKCFCFDQEHMKKDCQKRNSDMASAQRETEVPSLT